MYVWIISSVKDVEIRTLSDFIRLLSHSEITNFPLRALTAPVCVIEWNCQWPCCARQQPFYSFNDSHYLKSAFEKALWTQVTWAIFLFFFFFSASAHIKFAFAFFIWMNMENGSPVNLMGLLCVWLNDNGLQIFCCSRPCLHWKCLLSVHHQYTALASLCCYAWKQKNGSFVLWLMVSWQQSINIYKWMHIL